MPIIRQIKIFNEAFKTAWDLSVENSKLTPGIGPKLSSAIRLLMNDGATDSAEIGRAAYENVLKS